MKEFLQAIFKSTEERIKNPFIGAFITSWILFNWRPILFVIFSSKIIEEKISFIGENFIETNHILWYPLSAAIFYILILPYISLFFDILLKYSLLKRNDIVVTKQKQNIANQKQLAIEEIMLEEAKTDFRERNTHNKLVEELQKRNKDLEIEVQEVKELNRSKVDELKSELTNRELMTNDELRNFERRYSESRKEISDLNNKLFEKDQELQSLKIILSERERNDIEKLNRSVLKFENGMTIVEQFDGNKPLYFNTETREKYPEKEIKMLMDRFKYERM